MEISTANLIGQNNLLSRLREPDLQLLVPHFRRVESPPATTLYSPGEEVETVYFPCGATLISFMVGVDGDGLIVEALMVGREGAVGGIVSQGMLPAFTRIVAQSGGHFLVLPLAALDNAKAKSRTIENLFARYADCLLAQIFQSTACNAAHSIEQRTAKWILAAMDRAGSNEIALTQERLSSMLGAGRSYVSRVINLFKREEIMSVRRGRILIKDNIRLKDKACKCNDAIHEHFDIVLRGVYPNGADG